MLADMQGLPDLVLRLQKLKFLNRQWKKEILKVKVEESGALLDIEAEVPLSKITKTLPKKNSKILSLLV